MVRFPHPLVLLSLFILLAAALTYLLPAGQFERRYNAVAKREAVVPGSYHRVPASPVGLEGALLAVPRGLLAVGEVVFLIFLAGGAFTVLDQTGALRYGVDWLLRHAQGREVLVIPLVSLLFATMGALENMGEEAIALVPVLLVLTRRLGYPALTAVAASIGASFVGAAFSPINPFQVGIAQKLAQLPLLSGAGYRLVFLALALAWWIAGTVHYAVRHRVVPGPTSSPAPVLAAGLPAAEAAVAARAVEPTGTAAAADEFAAADSAVTPADDLRADQAEVRTSAGRHGLVLGLLLAAFAYFAYGVVSLGWDFSQMAALFLALGVAAGLLGGLGPTRTAEGFVVGFRDIAFSAILIGFARAISLVLEQGHVVDTLVQALAAPLRHLPVAAAALGMVGAQALLHLPVPSVSGQAVLTIPLLVPLSDLIGLSPQVAVLAYQYGAGLTDLLTPTNGALMAMLIACGVRYEGWLRFAGPLYAGLLALGAGAVLLGIWVGV